MFFRKILLSGVVQFFFIASLILMIKIYFNYNQINKISDLLFIGDPFSQARITSFVILGNEYALELELQSLSNQKSLDSIQFLKNIKGIRFLLDDSCEKSGIKNFRICHSKNDVFYGITQINFDTHVVGYVLTKKKYHLLFSDSISYNLLLILMVIVGGLVFNFIFLFFSVKNRILKNLNILMDFILAKKDAEKNIKSLDINECLSIAKKMQEEEMSILNLELEKSYYQALKNISAQVAHDIRSPLSALQVLTEQRLPELEESKRILLRDAVNHIRDIINNLDQKSVKKEKSITQVSVLLEHVLSERRTAFFEKPVKIIENITLESYSFFADIIQTEIKRVITNIINNAVEALPHQAGTVSINIYKRESQIIISITDDGLGIPQEVLNSLFSRGFTTKKTGSGLGLFHAKETLMQLGGDIDITSEVGKGATVFLKIPVCESPDWFVDALNVPDNSMVVCVDDSVSIWNAWQERFKEFQNNIQLNYCANKEELLLTLAKQTEKSYIYLVDYEFSGKAYTGLDLIKKIMSFKKEEDKVYLVTSRSGEELLQKFCFEHKIYMIPKFFALKIPIKVEN